VPAGNKFAQETQPLRRQFSDEKIGPCRIAAWPGEIGDGTELDRLIGDAKDDEDRHRCRFGGERGRSGTGRDDHRYSAADQIGGEFWKPIVGAFRWPDVVATFWPRT
jgi:hypothetical protein